MKVIKKGTIEKHDNGTIVKDFVIDCEGKPFVFSDFIELIGLPRIGKVIIEVPIKKG